MADEPGLEPFELAETDLVRGSGRAMNRRLFAKLNLNTYLAERGELALRQFARGSTEGVLAALVEQIHERFAVDPLWLVGEPELVSSWELSDGSKEFEYSIEYYGDPFLWECSPHPIDDELPEGGQYTTWDAPPGYTMRRPLGEPTFGHLLMVLPHEFKADTLDEIRAFIAWQEAIINKTNHKLQTELYMLAQSYEEMDRGLFRAWGRGF